MKIPAKSTADMRGDETPAEVQEQIRQRAYELFEKRGCEDGHALDDWLQAEAEIVENAKAVAA